MQQRAGAQILCIGGSGRIKIKIKIKVKHKRCDKKKKKDLPAFQIQM